MTHARETVLSIDPFENIVKGRAVPGILVFNLKGELVFINEEAKEVLKGLNDELGKETAPGDIYRLFVNDGAKNPGGQRVLSLSADRNYAVRAISLFRVGEPSHVAYTTLIIDRCTINRSINIDAASLKKKYNITLREAEVIGHLVKGATNQEIAGHLCLSEHTIKDYIKKIMQKLMVTSRSAIPGKVVE